MMATIDNFGGAIVKTALVSILAIVLLGAVAKADSKAVLPPTPEIDQRVFDFRLMFGVQQLFPRRDGLNNLPDGQRNTMFAFLVDLRFLWRVVPNFRLGYRQSIGHGATRGSAIDGEGRWSTPTTEHYFQLASAIVFDWQPLRRFGVDLSLGVSWLPLLGVEGLYVPNAVFAFSLRARVFEHRWVALDLVLSPEYQTNFRHYHGLYGLLGLAARF